MSLATHPLPVLRRGLTMHPSQRRLNCLTPTSLSSALGIHPGDDSTNDCGSEGDYCRDDCPCHLTHHAILARMWLNHNGHPDNLGHSQHSTGSDTISL